MHSIFSLLLLLGLSSAKLHHLDLFPLSPMSDAIKRMGLVRTKLKYAEHLGLSHHEKSALLNSLPEENMGNTYYIANVSVGTPPQTIPMLLDTGSTDWWFQHEEPNGDTLMQNGGPAYAANASSTASTNGTFWTAGYGMGNTNGTVFQDNIVMGGLTAQYQHFADVTNLTSGFYYFGFSGIAGLAWNKLSNISKTADVFIQNLTQQNSLPQIFAFYVSKLEDSQVNKMDIGGYDPNAYVGSITWLPVSAQYWWSLQLSKVTYGPRILPVSTLFGIIDSGSTAIVVPSYVHSVLMKMIGEDANGNIDCSTRQYLPTLSFTLAGNDMSLTPDQYTYDNGDGTCGHVFDAWESSYWIFGLYFLQNYYSIYDMENKRIGFAKPAKL